MLAQICINADLQAATDASITGNIEIGWPPVNGGGVLAIENGQADSKTGTGLSKWDARGSK